MPNRGSWVSFVVCSAVLLAIPGAPGAAPPPAMTNYQGVLRGAADEPLTGTFDMTFRFFDAETGGNELLVDQHLAAGGQAVTVEGGLFSVPLGGGVTIDGSGPGAYLSLEDVFRDNSQVWLEVAIGAETLTPRTRILAAGYALNAATAGSAASAGTAADATNLGGQPAAFYLNTSSEHQVKSGSVRFTTTDANSYVVEAIAQPGSPGALSAQGANAGCVLGTAQNGAYCVGNGFGGYFYDTNDSSYAYAGYGGYGIYAVGPTYGTYSVGTGASGIGAVSTGPQYGSYATATGASGTGLYAYGVTAAYFVQSNLPGPYTRIGWSGYGLYTQSYNGIHAYDYDDTGYSRIGSAPYKIIGSGAVSFVQNHPGDPDKVVVYSAPESSEVNVYTRGSARLVNGRARVALDPTFEWTANPDLGLTAHLTPRDEPVALAVESVSASEIVVRGPAGSDVAFDYWVMGLRIGFEELPPVQHKELDSAISRKASGAAIYAADPTLRAYNALERNKAMAHAAGRAVDPEMKAAHALRDRIGVSKPLSASVAPGHDGEPPVVLPAPAGPAATVTAASSLAEAAPPAGDRGTTALDPATPARFRSSERFPASTSIDPGDVVVIDPGTRGAVQRSDREADRTVVGVALTPAVGGVVEVAVGSVAEVRVDAGYGAIRPGDLLVSSPAPGAAMRAPAAEAGTILGKALEPLDSGLGTIRVLVMLR